MTNIDDTNSNFDQPVNNPASNEEANHTGLAKKCRCKHIHWRPGSPLPHYADKATAAAIITHHFFPISPRTIERWPLTVRRPNKATIYEVSELMVFAEEKLNAAYAYKQTEG